eukprot:567550-Pyramimonas_sp.AAC.1
MSQVIRELPACASRAAQFDFRNGKSAPMATARGDCACVRNRNAKDSGQEMCLNLIGSVSRVVQKCFWGAPRAGQVWSG